MQSYGYVLSDQHWVAAKTGCVVEQELPGMTGGRLAKVQAEGSASEEEEEWYDAAEEVEAVPLQAGASWWEQDNVDATDVEAHLLKDIHQKGMLCYAVHACCVMQTIHVAFSGPSLDPLSSCSQQQLTVTIPCKCCSADSDMTCHVALLHRACSPELMGLQGPWRLISLRAEMYDEGRLQLCQQYSCQCRSGHFL